MAWTWQSVLDGSDLAEPRKSTGSWWLIWRDGGVFRVLLERVNIIGLGFMSHTESQAARSRPSIRRSVQVVVGNERCAVLPSHLG